MGGGPPVPTPYHGGGGLNKQVSEPFGRSSWVQRIYAHVGCLSADNVGGIAGPVARPHEASKARDAGDPGELSLQGYSLWDPKGLCCQSLDDEPLPACTWHYRFGGVWPGITGATLPTPL